LEQRVDLRDAKRQAETALDGAEAQ
jgi:hypothetical protein